MPVACLPSAERPTSALSIWNVSWQHRWMPAAASDCTGRIQRLPQLAKQWDHRPGYQHESSALLFAEILYKVQSQAIIMFQESQTEKSPCTTATCCEKIHQALCFAPRKAHLLIKCRKHFQQGVYWESHDRSYLLELVLLTWGHSIANWCCELRSSTLKFNFFSLTCSNLMEI